MGISVLGPMLEARVGGADDIIIKAQTSEVVRRPIGIQLAIRVIEDTDRDLKTVRLKQFTNGIANATPVLRRQ
jgi:hypothetical protein